MSELRACKDCKWYDGPNDCANIILKAWDPVFGYSNSLCRVNRIGNGPCGNLKPKYWEAKDE